MAATEHAAGAGETAGATASPTVARAKGTGATAAVGTGLKSALLCAVSLAVYGNVLNYVAGRLSGRRRHAVGVAGPLALLALAFTWHLHIDRLTLEHLGLHRRRWPAGLFWGTLSGLALAVPPLIGFLLPRLQGMRLEFDELRVGRLAFMFRLLVSLPVLVAFTEEVAFRGLLYGKLRRAFPQRRYLPLWLSSLSFTLWHIVVNLRTLRESNVLTARVLPLPLALAAGLGGVFAGGVIFAGLYQFTGSLVAPVITHWLVDALMIVALYRGVGGQGSRVKD